jgi:sec-independent protein translocase protein TatB
MFDLEWSKLLVLGVVALLVIKPKDLPKALRTLGYWVRHARQVAAEFQSSIEQMAREAELADVKKDIEDATRHVTADIEKTIDPVEIEQLLNEPTGTPPPSLEPPAAETTPAAEAAAVPPPAAAPDEPTLPFPEPLPTTAPAGAEPSLRDRG